MSTHDMVLANDTGANFRADANNALGAVATQQSGTADPPAMFSYERQVRTDLGIVRRRNAANSAWIIDGTLAETFLVARSSNTILGQADHLRTIIATSTFTQTLTAAATLGDGWQCGYRNDGGGVITLDPNASETIDGATTITLRPGEACLIKCDGTNFKTIGRDIAGAVLQTVEGTPYATHTNISTQIPTDDTIPQQSTEGAELITVTIAGRSTSNRFRFEFTGSGVVGSAGSVTAALFQDSTENAIYAIGMTNQAGGICNVAGSHELAVPDTSSHTFKLRVGPNSSSANFYTNGTSSARLYGGVAAWRMRVVEIKG